MNRVQRNVFKAAAVAGIVLLLLFTAGCSGDLLGYIKYLLAQSGGIDLPKTGQTDSYGTGDDGELQMGVAWPVPRFTDNGNGTITDNLTGLMWDQSGDTASGTRIWAEAFIDCAGLSLGGHSDWRLPNVNELESLINAGEVDPDVWLIGQGFAAVQAQHYYSSTDWAPTSDDYVWIVSMSDGRVIGYHKDASCVLAVRSGQAGGTVSLPKTGQTTSVATGDDGALEMGVAWPVPRFTVGAETGCITDNLTGLMWEQAPSGTPVTWTAALTYAKDLDLGGHTDWRLPNRKELRSLINYSKEDTQVWLEEPEQGFSPGSVQGDYYWSSTTWASNITTAWCVRMYDGTVQPYLKAENHYVLAVRSGQ